MTPDARRSFERHWPQLAKDLQHNLSRRGVPAADRDDIVQDTAMRLLRAWDRLDLNKPVYPLASTIALNLLRDRARKKPEREVAFGELPERPSFSDVEREGLGRLDLQRVGRAMRSLTNSQRLVLLQEVDERPHVPDRGPAATKMLRMRARRRLATLLETASAVVGLGLLRFRRSTNDGSHSVAGALAAVAIVATLPGAAGPSLHQHRVESTGSSHHVAHVTRQHQGARRTHSGDATSVAALSSAPTLSGSRSVGPQPHHPVRIPLGNGEIDAEGTIDVNNVHVEVSDRGGPVPVCVDGVPDTPGGIDCPEG